MTDDRSARTLGAVLFLTAALFVGINRIITVAPLGEFWLAILLLALGVALIAWNIIEMRPRAASAGATVSPSGEMALLDGNPERVAVREFFPAPASERLPSAPTLGSPRGVRVAAAPEQIVVVEPILDDVSVDIPAPSDQAPISEQLATTTESVPPDELVQEDLSREEHPEGADGVRLASTSPVEPVIQVTPIEEPTLLPAVPAEALAPVQMNSSVETSTPEPTVETAVTATPKTDPVGQTVIETEVQPQQPHEAAQTGVVTPDIARQTDLPPTNPEAKLDGMVNKSALGDESAVAMSSPGMQGSAAPPPRRIWKR